MLSTLRTSCGELMENFSRRSVRVVSLKSVAGNVRLSRKLEKPLLFKLEILISGQHEVLRRSLLAANQIMDLEKFR